MKRPRRVWIVGMGHSGTTVACQVMRRLMDPARLTTGTEDPMMQGINARLLRGTEWPRDMLALGHPKYPDSMMVEEMMKFVETSPPVVKDPMLTATWHLWEQSGCGPDAWLVCMRSPDQLRRAWPAGHGWTRSVCQSIERLLSMRHESRLPVHYLSVPDVIANVDRYARVVRAASGCGPKEAADAVAEFVRPERYSYRED